MIKISFARSDGLDEVRRILQTTADVEYANFAHYRFQSDGLEDFCELLRDHSRSWKTLSLHACSTLTDDFLVHALFALQCNLVSLDLSSCKLNDQSIFALCHSVHSSSLRTVKFGSSSITNAGLIELARECPLLEQVHLAGCSQITDEGVVEALVSKSKRGYVPFSVLMLSACKKITNRAINYVAESQGEYLEKLSFSFCYRLTDSSMALLAQFAVNLRTINLCGCKALGDDTALVLFQRCPLLYSVSLNSCKRVSVATLRYLLQRRDPSVNESSPLALTFLDIRSCPLIEGDAEACDLVQQLLAQPADPPLFIKHSLSARINCPALA